MTRLLGSELRRLTSRRLVRWMLVVWVALLLLVVAIVTLNSGESDAAGAGMRTTQLWLSKALAADLGEPRDNVIPTISVLTYLFVIVIGASAIGAEYRAGTVGTILTWETRRVRLIIMRFVAAAIVGMAFFVVAHIVFIAAWSVGVSLRGSNAGVDAEFWRELVAVLARATVLAGVFAVLSGALATIGRNTAAAMGIWFGYLIAIEGILASYLEDLVPWLLIPNLAGVYEWNRVTMEAGQVVTPGPAAGRIVLYLVVIGGLAALVFRRRDVT